MKHNNKKLTKCIQNWQIFIPHWRIGRDQFFFTIMPGHTSQCQLSGNLRAWNMKHFHILYTPQRKQTFTYLDIWTTPWEEKMVKTLVETKIPFDSSDIDFLETGIKILLTHWKWWKIFWINNLSCHLKTCIIFAPTCSFV